MAQSGFTPISSYYSATASAVPTAGNLVAGELAINTNDGVLYYKDSSGVVQSIASKAGNSGSFTNLAYTGTLTGGTGVVNLGSGQFYKDASGNVGIGISTIASGVKLQVNGGLFLSQGNFTTANAIIQQVGAVTGSTNQYVPSSISFRTEAFVDVGAIAFNTNAGSGNTERMRIDSSGNVGIGGTAGDGYKLQLIGSSQNATTISQTYAGVGAAATKVTSGGAWAVGLDNANGSTERMRIDSTGNLLVGITTNTYASRMSVKSNADNVAAEFYRQGTGAGAGIVLFNSNSGGTESLKSYIDVATGALTLISDERLKENIVDIAYGLDQINALRPVSFEWKQGDGATNLGFIAQEVETIIPEAVTTLDESMSKTIPNQKMLNKDLIIPVLVKAIQELNAKVIALETQLGAK